jgi:hypothetical protein
VLVATPELDRMIPETVWTPPTTPTSAKAAAPPVELRHRLVF